MQGCRNGVSSSTKDIKHEAYMFSRRFSTYPYHVYVRNNKWVQLLPSHVLFQPTLSLKINVLPPILLLPFPHVMW